MSMTACRFLLNSALKAITLQKINDPVIWVKDRHTVSHVPRKSCRERHSVDRLPGEQEKVALVWKDLNLSRSSACIPTYMRPSMRSCWAMLNKNGTEKGYPRNDFTFRQAAVASKAC